MREINLLNVAITNGVAIIGKFDDPESAKTDLENKIKSIIGDNYHKLLPTCELLNKLEQNDSQERKTTFDLAKDHLQRKYTLIFLDQGTLLKCPEAVIELISEKRPLKLILVLLLENFSVLSKEILDAVFCNYANFIIGALTPKDETILKSRMPEF